MSVNYMTRKSYERLSEEARRLKEKEIPLVSREKLEAASQGDLRENAGYEAARDKLALLNARIRQITEQLSGTQFIEELKIPGDRVSVGTRITLIDLDDNGEAEYTILGPADADHARNIISYMSPIAKGIMGRSAGAEVVVAIPEGTRRFRIVAIRKYT